MSKKKELKRASKTFTTSVTDLDRIQEFLEEMALNGWILTSVSSSNVYFFEKCEPKKVRYYVDFFNIDKSKKNSRFTYQGRKEYIDLCVETGWEYVTSANGLLFFYAEDMKLAPIKEDDGEKFKDICKYYVLKNGGKPVCLLCLLGLAIFVSTIISNILQGNIWYTIMCDNDYNNMYYIWCIMFFVFSGSTSLAKFYIFYKKNKNQIEKNGTIKYLSIKEDEVINKVKIFVTFIWLTALLIYASMSSFYYGMLIALIIVSFSIYGIYEAKKEGRIFGHIKTHKLFQRNNLRELTGMLLVTIVLFIGCMGYRYSKDMLLPKDAELKLTDLGIDKEKYTDFYESDNSRLTLFSDTKSYYLDCSYKDKDYVYLDLTYEVINSKYSKALTTYRDHILDEYDGVYVGEKEQISKWNAEEVYYINEKESQGIMIVYKERVIYIIINDYDKTIDFEGKYIDVIKEKLNK